MSISAIPSTGLTLHGLAAIDQDPKHDTNPAILFRLNDSLLEDVKKASSCQGGLQLLTGSAPKIRLGKRTIDLTISPEAFRHELYTASTDSLSDFDFAGIVSHRAELKVPERKQSLGSDAALAALQSSLASYQQEKQAKSVNISNNLVAVPKHRWDANREQKQAKKRGLLGSHSSSPPIGTGGAHHVGSAPTSVPAGESFARAQAMKTPLLHLLAVKPLSTEDIIQKTHIPHGDLEEMMQKIGKQDAGKWQLTDRSYRDLDVWKFGYSTKERDAAIENAIRAYDRMRLGKDEKLWQMLLREEERDKGKILSKLHLGGGPSKLTPNLAASPMPEDGQAISASNTPRLGPSSAPKVGTKKNEAGSFEKKLFSNKDPKKRALEDAKEKKRREKEAAAASDREGGKPARKKQTIARNNPKVKSEELVRSSSDESEGEERNTPAPSSSQPKAAAADRKPLANANAKKQTATTSSTLSEAAAKVKSKVAAESAATPKAGTPASKQSSATKGTKSSTAGKNTPNGLSAPASQHRSQLSPQKPGSRPSVPSPLGAARPRVASDVSDRGAVGVQRVRQGAETPKGLGITNGIRKRQDTVTSNESYLSSNSDKMNGDQHKANAVKSHKPGANGAATSKSSLANGNTHKGENGLKRKTVDSPSTSQENGHAVKHRKTESTSSQSQKSRNGSIGATSSTDAAPLERSTSSESTGSIINDITFSQGVNIAQKFRDEYYPAYAKLYDEQAAMEKRGETVPRHDRQRLWDMHKRLEQMKREIKAASRREHLDE
ncbi:hypothetical protein M409DRAFT_19708 [Zasmidium cellare ATCC 36951]|uniref:Uncharacterized protein n=1 Tax=Zasmidium cellare ATCC 36951 TaxID=1080233 RepID=A0A6A6CSN3_ZASCE|nr:uncharacterized protein M409DRAFT_19708 [Zasmidium cellare ATCC 36951]KAF2170101.1 hypothetical protein M409DRAFT_19708 [Zasmidium cellare ATCC 36951]